VVGSPLNWRPALSSGLGAAVAEQPGAAMARALRPGQPRGLGKRASLGRPVQLLSEPSNDQLVAVIDASYRQLLNRVPLASERLGDAGSQLRNGVLTVADVIDQITLSEPFQQRLQRMASLRAASAAYLALLGRAAHPAEVSRFLGLRASRGQRATAEEILASANDAASFGRDTVPYLRGLGTSDGQPLTTVIRTAQLYGGNAALNPPRREPIRSLDRGEQPLRIPSPPGRPGSLGQG
jgi:phycobilisome core-membrane linker protein